MTQKNLIIALLVGLLLIVIIGITGRQYGGFGMMGVMHDGDDMYEEMEEHMDAVTSDEGEIMFDEMKEHMDDNGDVHTSADNAPPGSIHNLPVPDAVNAVKNKVATELGIRVGAVIVMSAYEQEWSDGCLGLGGAAESCLATITPGYEVTVLAQGSERVFRTNADGSNIREEQR